MKSERQYWVFVDKTKIGRDPESVKIFGSVVAMQKEEDITVEGKVLTDRALRYRLGKTGYWENEKYLIRKTTIIRSTQKH